MTSFRIETYTRNHLEGLTTLYNTETAFEPHIAPLDPERLVRLVEQKSAFDPAGLFVALNGSQVLGWIHACVAAGTEPWHNPEQDVPRIRMLIFPRERLDVGNALVSEATAWLEHPGLPAPEAMHASAGYPFYRGLWLGGEPMGTPTMPHVQLAFEAGGYKNTHESIFMTAKMDTLPLEIAPDVPLEYQEMLAEMKHTPMRESWIGFEPMRIQALVEGSEAGSLGWALLPHVAERLGAPVLNIWQLGVSENHRRKGIAAALVARAMRLGYEQGARFASVGTQLWNTPAHATYARQGFSPYCVLVGRERKRAQTDTT